MNTTLPLTFGFEPPRQQFQPPQGPGSLALASISRPRSPTLPTPVLHHVPLVSSPATPRAKALPPITSLVADTFRVQSSPANVNEQGPTTDMPIILPMIDIDLADSATFSGSRTSSRHLQRRRASFSSDPSTWSWHSADSARQRQHRRRQSLPSFSGRVVRRLATQDAEGDDTPAARLARMWSKKRVTAEGLGRRRISWANRNSRVDSAHRSSISSNWSFHGPANGNLSVTSFSSLRLSGFSVASPLSDATSRINRPSIVAYDEDFVLPWDLDQSNVTASNAFSQSPSSFAVDEVTDMLDSPASCHEDPQAVGKRPPSLPYQLE